MLFAIIGLLAALVAGGFWVFISSMASFETPKCGST